MCVRIRVKRNLPVVSKANESPRRLYTLFGGGKIVEWFKALNYPRSDRCCLKIEF